MLSHYANLNILQLTAVCDKKMLHNYMHTKSWNTKIAITRFSSKAKHGHFISEKSQSCTSNHNTTAVSSKHKHRELFMMQYI